MGLSLAILMMIKGLWHKIIFGFTHCILSLLYRHMLYTSLLKPATPDLREFLVKARRGAVRLVKVVIKSGE